MYSIDENSIHGKLILDYPGSSRKTAKIKFRFFVEFSKNRLRKLKSARKKN